MKKILIAFLAAVLLLPAVGCNQTPPDVPDPTENSHGEPLVSDDHYDQFSTDIYLCDDVYRTDETPTHGSGFIALPMTQDALAVEAYEILLCDDRCDPTAVASRVSQGYAPVYHVVSDGEFDGNFRTLKFKMQIPEPMVEDLKNQGAYETVTEQIESNYYYLLVLDKTHYAYIHLARRDGANKSEQEAELADSIVKNARVSFNP